MAIIGLGFLKNLQRAWFKYTAGSANGMVTPGIMLIGTDGEPYNAAGGGAFSSTVYGPDIDGVPPTHAPVLIAGWDGVNLHTLATSSAGIAKVGTYDSLNNAITSSNPGTPPTSSARGLTSLSINYAQFNDAGFSTPTEGQWYNFRITKDRSLIVSPRATTGANSSVAGTVTNNTTILASNTGRKGATIYNDNDPSTGATLYLSLGAACTVSSYTIAVQPTGYYELPFGYIGIVTGVFSSAAGNARVTELV